MTHHQDSLFNIPLAIVLITMPWWGWMVDDYSWLMGKLLLPTAGGILVVLQIWYAIRKHKHLGGKDSK